MKAILATAAMLAPVAPAAAQYRPRIAYQQVPTTVIVTTTNWQAPPPPPQEPDEDYQPRIPYAPLPFDAAVFSGVRIEAQAGWDAYRNRRADDLIFGRDGGSRDGFTYGGELGFDVPLGRSVTLGGYGGIEGTTIDPCYDLFGSRLCATPKLGFTAGGRLGVAVGRGALLYAKGGYSLSRLRVTVTDPIPANNFRSTGNIDGFHVGAGVEAALSGRVYGKLEYVYTRFGGYDDEDLGADSSINVDRHQVKAGVGVRL